MTLVVECKTKNIIIGSLKLLFERKFFKNGCLCAYYEDLIIDKEHRQQGLGTLLNKTALQICESKKCHRVVLIGDDENVSFYLKKGYKRDGIALGKKWY